MKPITCPNCKTVFEPIISNSRFSCPSCKTCFCLTQKPDGSWSARIESRPAVQSQPTIIVQNMAQPRDTRDEDARNHRRDVLQRAIMGYASKGYLIVSQTETSAQLQKPQKFKWIWFFIFWGFYLIHYWTKKKELIYLMVDSQGNLNNKSKGGSKLFWIIMGCLFFPPYPIYLGIKWVLNWVKQDEPQRKWAKYVMFGFFALCVLIAIIQMIFQG